MVCSIKHLLQNTETSKIRNTSSRIQKFETYKKQFQLNKKIIPTKYKIILLTNFKLGSFEFCKCARKLPQNRSIG